MIEGFRGGIGKKYTEQHNGRIALRVDHGSKNSNGRKVERSGKKPKAGSPPSDFDIQEGIEDYFANK